MQLLRETPSPFFGVTSEGGNFGRIKWTNAAPYSKGIVWGLVQWDIWWPFSNKPFEADGPKLAERCEEMVEDLAWTGTPFELTGASHGSQEGPGVVFYVRRKPSS